ncbi:hypothetical protein GIS00_03670 [Nakamurella sp. YIM 132087]|uniref:VCBS repeat-containing protein n=1 Tax=Nakamurella alba TaxID=2665158 RepID=A0A7K1FJJ9_9ACTN|nr:hypothetical protein [Nakamurella alba]MTD13044.1 hypothetical protein [Nakamurella alba]
MTRFRRRIHLALLATVGMVAASLAAAPVAVAAAPVFTDVPTNQVNGGPYFPVVGDFGGAATDDIFWYHLDGGVSFLWRSKGDGTFTSTPYRLTDRVRALEIGDFVGDERDEIVFATGGDRRAGSMWRFDVPGRTMVSSPLPDTGERRSPVAIHNAAAKDDLLITGTPTTIARYSWPVGGKLSVSSRPVTTPGGYQPTVADLDGNGWGDLYWSAPGVTSRTWFALPTGTGSSRFLANTHLGSGYSELTIPAPLDGWTGEDLLKVNVQIAGNEVTTTGYLWGWADQTISSGKPVSIAGSVLGTVRTGSADSEVLVLGATGSVLLWHGTGTPGIRSTGNADKVGYRAVIGEFTASGRSSILWWAAGATPERIYLG